MVVPIPQNLNFTEAQYALYESQRKYFLTNLGEKDYSFLDWLGSKGTSFECYVDYMMRQNPDYGFNQKINYVRVILLALTQPFSKMYFFFWTMTIFFLHKFKFKKPVMKIILFHFLLRAIGDILDKTGDLFPTYFALSFNENTQVYSCHHTVDKNEYHPLKFFITRQAATIFWYTGEMVGDWYPLLRTKAVVKNKKKIMPVYITCIIFNITKIVLILNHLFLYSLKKTYTNDGIYNQNERDKFYNRHWIIQFTIMIGALLYDLTVFFVLKKYVFKVTESHFGFFKKFKAISEYRIFFTAGVSLIFVPVAAFTLGIKFWYNAQPNYKSVEFDFDDLRLFVASIQYYMMFIDQILLCISKNETSSNKGSYNNISSKEKSYKNYSPKLTSSQMTSSQMTSPQIYSPKIYNQRNINSQYYYDNLSNENNRNFNKPEKVYNIEGKNYNKSIKFRNSADIDNNYGAYK
ncbi:hypothetical protein BCR32DRAFT_293658 [Anaeromyces robustus]|uniref:Uncharacterized protein n=1 Tax=Anaeromyces robustus TaxID=1754192 RepID=A0A1Y1X540_9FUNG|nr:hypothetical protein BCR32DRAFT_293658 [Anaeromyces robustus]|eukprot:ORX80768.1 hypothetical protein BCR32DRAFT_293658 [Anaeromyces robustus]